MSLETGQHTGEKEPPLSGEIRALELRVNKLVGGVGASLNKVSTQKLAETAAGQSKLLKLYDSARQFNQTAQGIVASLASISFLTEVVSKLASDPALQGYAQLGYKTTATAALVAGFICLLRSNKFQDEARSVLDKLKKE